jgi:copper chaperone CopZ
MVETVYCVHCGAIARHPVTKTIKGQSLAFCCGGCLQVYELMHEEDLLPGQGGQGAQLDPIDPAPTPAGDSLPSQTITFNVLGMSCSNCVAAVERRLRSVPGVLDAGVVLETEQATVRMMPGRVTMADLKGAVEAAGYRASFTS